MYARDGVVCRSKPPANRYGNGSDAPGYGIVIGIGDSFYKGAMSVRGDKLLFEFKARTSKYTINKVLYSVLCAYAREAVV